MMQLNKRNQLTTAIVTLLVTTPLWATNGYFTHGTGTKNKGMAGSGLAMSEDAISMANNPAAALTSAGKYDLGLAIFTPLRHYKTTDSMLNGNFGAFTIGPNDLDSNNNLHFIPHMAGSWKINDKSAWAAAFYGRGGMNTKWDGGTATFDPDGPGPAPVATYSGTYGGGLFGGNGAAGVDLSQAFLDVGYARSFGDNFTLGASLVGVMQVFAARGVGTFAAFTETFAASGGTEQPANLSNNGHDSSFGLGVKVGLQWDITDKFAFAASYAPKIGMSKLKDYSDLFADGGNMDIPADLKAGLTFRPSEGFALNFDVEKMWYSDIPSVGNPFSNLFACPTAGAGGTSLSNCLGGKNGAGFGWDDMIVYKIGGEWSSGNDWTWRAGYSFGDQPIPETEMVFNILAPATIEKHATLGFTRKLSSGDEFNMSFMYAFKNELSGPNVLDPTQMIYMDMKQWEIEFSYGWR
jgi:long-chain fatty acid transport protein